MRYIKIIGILLFLLFFTYAGSFFAPDFYRKYDKPSIIFLLLMYLLFYLIDYLVQGKISNEKLAGKDLVFIVLKFLIPLIYVTVKTYFIDPIDRKAFLLHFLVYAVLSLAIDTIINYQIIKKNH